MTERFAVLAGLVLLVCSSFLATASAQEPAPPGARQALETFSDGLQSLSAEFTQVIIGTDGVLLEEGEGEVALAHPGLFRWSYLGEFPELIVADGEKIWMYDEGLEQVTVRAQSGQAGDSPLLLLTDLSGLDEQFQVTELGTITGLSFLELIATDAEVQFERMVLAFDGNTLTRLILEDAFGMRTEMRFEKLERNPDLADDLFRFSPPEGVDVVGDFAPATDG